MQGSDSCHYLLCDIRHMTKFGDPYSALNPSKVHTHSSEHTNIVNTQPEQSAAIYVAPPGEHLGVSVPCSWAPRCGIEGGGSAVHSLSPHTIPAGPRFELATFRLRERLSNH